MPHGESRSTHTTQSFGTLGTTSRGKMMLLSHDPLVEGSRLLHRLLIPMVNLTLLQDNCKSLECTIQKLLKEDPWFISFDQTKGVNLPALLKPFLNLQ